MPFFCLRNLTLAFLVGLAFACAVPEHARAAEQVVGGSCSGSANTTDWDTIAQCSGGTFVRVPTFLAGGIAIGTTSLTSGAVLDAGSNTSSIYLPSGTTAQEPSSPVAGMFRYNNTYGQLEYYNGSAWIPFNPSGACAGSA